MFEWFQAAKLNWHQQQQRLVAAQQMQQQKFMTTQIQQ
jgi:hypothetical protein